METVKETLSSAATTVSNAAASVTNAATGGQTEEHRSMVDDSVTTDEYSSRVETARDAMNTEKYNRKDQQQLQSQRGDGKDASGSSHDATKAPSGPGGMGKPQGSNVTGTDLGADTNKDAHSNKDEPNSGFGGGGGKGSSAEPSLSVGSQPADGGGGGIQPKLPDDKSLEEGTGMKYEKSTGLKADGGDFDAARPGAGREADRLLEEMGIQHGPGGGTAGQKAHGSVSDPPGDDHKRGLGEKIKDKLHH